MKFIFLLIFFLTISRALPSHDHDLTVVGHIHFSASIGRITVALLRNASGNPIRTNK